MHDPAYTDALEAALADHLSTITEHWDGMATRPAIRPRVGRRTAPESTLPASASVMQVRAEAQAHMRTLGQALLEEHPDTDMPPVEAYGPVLAHWLWEHVTPLAATVDAGEVDKLGTLARRVLAHSAPTRPDWMRVGTCPLLLEDGAACAGEVRAWPHWTDEDGNAWCECRGCGTKEVASWWEARGMGTVGDVLTTDEVCALAWSEFGRPLPSVTVRRWVHEGRIAPLSAGARPLKFRREDVVRTLAVMC